VRRTGGFTLIEVMITVAIIGILTTVLVFSFTSQPRRVKSRTEVLAMFAAMHAAEAGYSLEHGTYYSTGSDSTDVFPATPAQSGQTVGTVPDEWDTLRLSATSEKLFCSYVAVAGTASDTLPDFSDYYGMVQPIGSWNALNAECDMDGSSTLNGTFFSSSVDPTMQRRNETH
jgi:prepilin-type N-terminal cleavage/methylation domain-containing protein